MIEEKKQYKEKNKAEFDGITAITPKLDEIKKQEKQVKDKAAKQKEEKQRFVCILFFIVKTINI